MSAKRIIFLVLVMVLAIIGLFINQYIIKKKSVSLFHTVNYMMGQVINKGLGFILIPITTAIMSQEEYAINSLFSSTVNIFVIIMPLCLYRGVIRFYYDKKYERKQMLGNQFLLMIIYMSVLGATFLATISLWGGLTGLTKYLCVLMLASTFMQAIINFYLAYLQSHKDSTRYAVLSIIYAACSTIFGVYWMTQLVSEHYFGLVYAILICRTLFAIFGVFDMWKDMTFKMDKQMHQEIYHFCLPLIPHMISSFLLNYVDRYMINSLVSPAASGLYSFAYNFGLIVNIVVLSINQAYSPEFLELVDEKNYQGITKRVNFYQKGLLSIAACVVIFAGEVIVLMTDPKFHAGISIVPMICYGYILFHLYATISAYSTYYKKTTYIAVVSMISGVINVFLNYLFISKYGYEAAAYTTAASYFIQYVICRLGNKYYLKIEMHDLNQTMFRVFGFMILTYFGLMLIGNNHSFIITFIYKIILLLVTFAYVWKDEIGHVFFKSNN